MDPVLGIHFTAYVALAVVLYAIRQATGISNKYIPLIAIIFGMVFAAFEVKAFNFAIMIQGIQYGLYGIGTVATIKYALEKQKKQEK